MQTIRTTISIPKKLHEQLSQEAETCDTTLSQIIVQKIMSKEIEKRTKALAEIRKLAKKANTKGIKYKELIEDGRRY
jgi:predicted transcriptional regulator